MLSEPFEQHPLPWRAEGIFDADEAWAVVYDANGHEVWRVEDTDKREMRPSDILLARMIAALPELLACCAEKFDQSPCRSFADELSVIAAVADAGLGRSNTAAGLRERATRIRAALVKAGVRGARNV